MVLKVEERTVETDQGVIVYRCIRKPVKNINMRIDVSGQIIVSADYFLGNQEIDRFVASKAEWIHRKKSEISKKINEPKVNLEEVFIFGRPLKVKYVSNGCARYDSEYLYVPKSIRKSKEDALNQGLLNLCAVIYADMADVTYSIVKKHCEIQMPTIKVRLMRTRWGSCNPSACRITLNRSLIHYPIDFIEYVILHEFVHLIVPNHSKEFYAFVEEIMPDYKKRMKLVK